MQTAMLVADRIVRGFFFSSSVKSICARRKKVRLGAEIRLIVMRHSHTVNVTIEIEITIAVDRSFYCFTHYYKFGFSGPRYCVFAIFVCQLHCCWPTVVVLHLCWRCTELRSVECHVMTDTPLYQCPCQDGAELQLQ